MDINLKRRVERIVDNTVNYKNQLYAFQTNYNNIRNEYSELKSIVDLNPSVVEFLKVLQLKQHENSVGTYEKLLTSLLMEVLPGYREVVLNLTTLRQSPALDVLIKKDPLNPAEDVLRGTGGSVTNIIVAGFRIISVVRSGHRKFLLLDEADCWLKDDYFPSFSKMLKEVSEKLGVQILLISHDKNSYFSGVIDHQVEIYKDREGKILSRFNELPDWDVDDDIVKSIRLENFQSHEDTFIPLSPTITILRGDNDLGKSSIASAFRAVFYGEGAESDIKHFTNKSTVTLEFNKEGKCLIWERKLKGSPVESFTMYSQTHGYSTPLHQTSGLTRGSVPEWLMDETGMGKFDDLDVQLTWQKEPLAFLSAGPHVRAKALAVGSEADYVQKMMILAKKKNTENKSLLKSKESLIESQRQYIIPLKKSLKIDDGYFKKFAKDSEQREQKISSLKILVDEISQLSEKSKLLKHSLELTPVNIKSQNHVIKELKRVELELSNVKNNISVLSSIKGMSNITINSKEKQLKDLKALFFNFDNEIKKNEVLNQIKNVSTISIDDKLKQKIAQLKMVGVSLNKEIKLRSTLSPIATIAPIEKIKCDEAKKRMLNDLIFELEKTSNINTVISNIKNLSRLNLVPSSLKDKINNVKKIGVELKSLSNEAEKQRVGIKNLNSELAILDSEIKRLYPVCPTCNRAWDENHSSVKKHV